MLDLDGKALLMTNTLSFCQFVYNEEQRFTMLTTGVQCYKMFIFVSGEKLARVFVLAKAFSY
jgi:hypothetical protein